ncbi:hypothetical protein RND81_06G233800 [Saponaria officinalis]|uniref:SHSP domain-containing protein n=1 Tax=Saponaria officinalis TaxID=3572 RepID=A0AAW1KEX8_SAPOF
MAKSVIGLLLVIAVLIGTILPSKGRLVDWSKVCCKKGGDGVDMVKADVISGIKGDFITLEVAGINDLKIEVKKDAREVWVSGECAGPNSDFGHHILFERTYGHFWRRFEFPPGSLMDHLEFRFHDGVLHISAPYAFS